MYEYICELGYKTQTFLPWDIEDVNLETEDSGHLSL